jgi:hypothetical protein
VFGSNFDYTAKVKLKASYTSSVREACKRDTGDVPWEAVVSPVDYVAY